MLRRINQHVLLARSGRGWHGLAAGHSSLAPRPAAPGADDLVLAGSRSFLTGTVGLGHLITSMELSPSGRRPLADHETCEYCIFCEIARREKRPQAARCRGTDLCITKHETDVNIVNDERQAQVGRQAEELARRLRTIRERKGFTQGDVGKRAGLSAAAISQLESGERRPNFNTLVSLAAALEVTPDSLIGLPTGQGNDPELRGLFRKLEGMTAQDISTVRAFVRFLEEEKARKEVEGG